MNTKIIVALDVPTLEEAIALVEKLDEVSFWKVGLELFVSTGPKILEELKSRSKRIFLDLKFHDIPNTIAGACRVAALFGVDLLTIHAVSGRDTLKAATEAIQAGSASSGIKPPKLIAVSLLTSISSRQLAIDLKIPIELPEYVLEMALMAQEMGLDGAVCSPQEVAQLRDSCGSDFLLVCPGVRPTWAAIGDQKRVFTPAQALKAGADYLVIGRPITASADPQLAWKKVCDEIAAVV
ncbi:orotidine-5'-phosphate decarboxylase [Aetokthonos hydrillicola Thurmond2011]|jgi:orotidine-5'-phosphate decarboxylase|uniref:Orotidine 5'-phosphate decarboxylase n=2 Tax=Aetokthonos TaxID=1550243 RepID=A0AAP5M768_9CYAN|nr:orotidine-5'-phosphate decarboxylase [Aetokthonos hydrillicola]MBW4588087.1 orotidine-5'-phosphate decarboxylase [Aetokthonos hydrillicola CCALA 1050]MDR9893402.1 orotidine-5'-phosphate decarboxylase [Aetokthonos hydrillicola Thurmond2011]